MRNDVQIGRFVRAVFIVAAIVLAVPIANLAAGSHSGDGANGPGSALVRFPGSEAVTDDPFDVLQVVDDAIRDSTVPVPEYFEEEIGLPAGCRDVRTDGESTVGFIVDGEASEAMRSIDEHMKDEGWSSVPLGETEGATYMKEGGACRWALVTCTQVGDASSVVYRCIAQ